jgi:hypothetical protein
MEKVTCPYCGESFPGDYYYSTHDPCPEPHGDGALDPLDDDRDQSSPFEYSEDYDWSGHDFNNDPDWR